MRLDIAAFGAPPDPDGRLPQTLVGGLPLMLVGVPPDPGEAPPDLGGGGGGPPDLQMDGCTWCTVQGHSI